MADYYTPLRYPGGKAKLTKKITSIITDNNLAGGAYVEPYAGGAGIAMELLVKGVVRDIFINDINVGVYAFWKSILEHTDEFCMMIKSTEVSMETWHRQKDILNSVTDATIELAFATFFLNRTNYSGVIKGGVIGGKNQNGNYKLNCRFNKEALIERIRIISSFKEHINVYNKDAQDFINAIKGIIPANSLVYLDPPYYVKGQGLYINHYSPSDHAELSDFISRQSFNWIVSYDDVPEIRLMYELYDREVYSLNYSAHNKCKSGQEVMFFSKSLNKP